MRVIIAGGGTGGHLFPGIAIAEEFLRRDPWNKVLFVGTERGLEKRVLKDLRYELRTLNVEGIKGRGMMKSLRAILKLPGSLLDAGRILKDFAPRIVIGVGGYASGPAVLAAFVRGVPTAVAEQNALPGLTNRILGRVVDRIFLSFPDTGGCFPRHKTMVTGNPVRSSFLASTHAEKTQRSSKQFTVLVFGGSQGARTVNLTVVAALGGLEGIREKLRIIHQTGEADADMVERAYRVGGFNAVVKPFIMDMAGAYREADLLVCRAGATTLAEITAMGKAAILIPFPFAVGDHQTRNAEVLVQAGAAVMIHEGELTGEILARTITELFNHRQRLIEMGEKAAQLGNINAARDIVDACLSLLRREAIEDNTDGIF